MGEEPQEARDRPAARLLYQLHPYHPVYIHPERMSKAPPSRLRKTEEPFVNLRHPVTPISDKTALYGKP